MTTTVITSWADGYTQPGTSPNTLAGGDNAILRIELDGSSEVSGAGIGLFISCGSSTVRGLAVYRFYGAGIELYENQSNPPGGSVVEGNFVGTDVTGSVRKGNGSVGVVFSEHPRLTNII